MIFKRRTKHYLILTPTEASLALRALLHFRNKAIARSIDSVDIEMLIEKLTQKANRIVHINCPLLLN